MPIEATWVVPSVDNLTTVMDQLVLNAAEPDQLAPNGAARGNALLNTVGVQRIRAAVRASGKVPLSSRAGSVPPEAEAYAYVLTADAMTAAKPNVAGVVMMPNGSVVCPWMTLVKDAKAWIQDVYAGKKIVTPPDSPLMVGTGNSLIPIGTAYPTGGTYSGTGLFIGQTYVWSPGADSTSFTCGATTLTAGAAFVASAATYTVAGTAGVLISGSLQRGVVAANYAGGGRIHGEVDMSTPGAGGWDTYGRWPGQQGYSLAHGCPDPDNGFW